MTGSRCWSPYEVSPPASRRATVETRGSVWAGTDAAFPPQEQGIARLSRGLRGSTLDVHDASHPKERLMLDETSQRSRPRRGRPARDRTGSVRPDAPAPARRQRHVQALRPGRGARRRRLRGLRRARSSRSSATTAPASRRSSRRSQACSPPTRATISIDGKRVQHPQRDRRLQARHRDRLSGPRPVRQPRRRREPLPRRRDADRLAPASSTSTRWSTRRSSCSTRSG